MQKDMETGPKEEIMVDGKPVMATVTGVNDMDQANADVSASLCSLPAAVLALIMRHMPCSLRLVSELACCTP